MPEPVLEVYSRVQMAAPTGPQPTTGWPIRMSLLSYRFPPIHRQSTLEHLEEESSRAVTAVQIGQQQTMAFPPPRPQSSLWSLHPIIRPLFLSGRSQVSSRAL